MEISLSPRLLAAERYIRAGAALADIGTDHAYLPIFAVLSGKCEYAVASDINNAPLMRAKDNVAAYGLSERIKCVLSDGFEKISGFTDAAICGMGGELTARIIEKAGTVAAHNGVRLILQPMTRLNTVRQCILRLGFDITEEYTMIDSSKYYTVICADYDGKARAADNFSLIYGDFSKKRFSDDDVRRGYIEHEIDKLCVIIKGKTVSQLDTSVENAMIKALGALIGSGT
ncbi:MAG: class I SAM-dependent methyltransferase [Clostridia bacterium]|nr:class I SAM-dependent methyltransferase [Clostridia bacterium]